jgi:hypothetical protein
MEVCAMDLPAIIGSLCLLAEAVVFHWLMESSGHQSRHPQKKRTSELRKPEPSARQSESPEKVFGYLRAIGIVGVLWTAATAILPYYFRSAVGLIYVTAFVGLADLYIEKALPKALKIVGASLIVVATGLFTYAVVVVSDELFVSAYAMHNEYSPGTVIAGIPWDPRFTDLRVVADNKSNDYLQNVGLEIWTQNEWIYQAKILDGPTTCELNLYEGGEFIKMTSRLQKGGTESVKATRAGNGVDFHDSLGNQFTTVATKSYRLFCSAVPPKMSIQITLALVTVKPELLSKIEPQKAGSFGVAELSNTNSLIDWLSPRPFPQQIKTYKTYTRSMHPFSTGAVFISVASGD